MSQASQATPSVTANFGGNSNQVNLRDYLNVRVAPFLKKAITESLDAAPEFPLQWLGENLIRQSLLFEGNPDRTKIQERFLYKFETPVATSAPGGSTVEPVQNQSDTLVSEQPANSVPVTNGSLPESESVQDVQMSTHVNGAKEEIQRSAESGDTEMTETTHD